MARTSTVLTWGVFMFVARQIILRRKNYCILQLRLPQGMEATYNQ